MKETSHIPDELLARFLDNQTNEQETEAVLAYLNEDKEHLDEFLYIREAARLADSTCGKKVDMGIAKNRIQKVTTKKKNHGQKSNVIWIWSCAAAATIVLLIAGIFFLRQHSPNKIDHPQVAQSVVAKDSVKDKDTVNISNSQADVSSKKQLAENHAANPKEEQSYTPTVQNLERASGRDAHNSFSMLNPSKSPYRILCKSLRTELNFQWKSANVKSTHFCLKNDQKGTLIDKSKSSMDSYTITYKDIYPLDILFWEVTVTYKDGTQHSEHGVISIDYQL